MKMLLTAIALTIASPAIAQTAAPADAHAGHHGQAKPAEAQPSKNPHADHQMGMMHMGMMSVNAMKAHCEKMKAQGMTMDGCNMHAGSKAKAGPHADHDMSPQ